MANSIAALLTSYNRKATTLASLDRLFSQQTTAELTVFLVDDNSPDGTADAVQKQFPQVRLLPGDGNLFWCGGMRCAFDAALKEGFDFYLWLNDDTLLEPDAVARMLAAYQSLAAENERAIVVGSTRDPQTGVHTYGGVVRSSRIHPNKYRLQEPGDKPLPCDTMNGNCVLIPSAVAAVVHSLSPEFQHGMGDFDYGLRARKAGCAVWVAPGYIGDCAANGASGGFEDARLAMYSRWRHMMSNKGLPPREYLVYMRRHGGSGWPLYWAMPYVRVIVSSLFARPRKA
jgi:GT2 family glycosyltransferase